MTILREFKDEDRKSLVMYLNNEHITRYLSSRIALPYTDKDARLWISKYSKEGINKAIECDGALMGTIGIRPGEYEYSRTAEIGYWIGQQYWGKGIATSALEEMTKLIFSSTEITRLYAPVFVGNHRSIRVLEKCGYCLEGVFKKAIYKKGVFYDEAIYAKIDL